MDFLDSLRETAFDSATYAAAGKLQHVYIPALEQGSVYADFSHLIHDDC